ncbi:MAG: rhomboid family intramembrane serine protease [Bacteroidia bacterium]
MNQLSNLWRTSNATNRLIIANIAVFVVINIPLAVLHLLNMDSALGWLMKWLTLPGDFFTLLTRPWTIITHMFMHTGLLHLLFNMLSLFFISQLFSRYFDDRRLINVYFVSGLAGAFVFLLSINIFPIFGDNATVYTAAGASAAVMGTLVAVCTYRPLDEVFLFGVFRLQLRWVALIFVLLDLIGISGGNEGGHLAHLGGALFGFIWGINLGKGNDLAAFFQTVQDLFKRQPRRKKSPLTVAHKQRFTDEEWNLSKKERQIRVDEILDKISRSGYDSLSKEEKALLFELSKESDA